MSHPRRRTHRGARGRAWRWSLQAGGGAAGGGGTRQVTGGEAEDRAARDCLSGAPTCQPAPVRIDPASAQPTSPSGVPRGRSAAPASSYQTPRCSECARTWGPRRRGGRRGAAEAARPTLEGAPGPHSACPPRCPSGLRPSLASLALSRIVAASPELKQAGWGGGVESLGHGAKALP